MAVETRIDTTHENVFKVTVRVLSVDPVEDFDKRNAGAVDTHARDKVTGKLLWAVSVIDPSAPVGRREIKVKIPADHQPVPPNGIDGAVEFDGLQVIPYVDTSRSRPRVGIAYRATGFRPARKHQAVA